MLFLNVFSQIFSHFWSGPDPIYLVNALREQSHLGPRQNDQGFGGNSQVLFKSLSIF
jgi:hypothetical protein